MTGKLPLEPETGEADPSGNGGGGSAPADSHLSTVTVSWEGPLPPPALLEQYDQVTPGLAAQIAEEAKAEAIHLREQDKAILKAAIEDRSRRHWMGFLIAAGIVAIALLAIVSGDRVTPGIALSVVAAAAAVFVLERRKKEKKEREE